MLHLLYQTFQVDIYTQVIVALLSGCAAILTKEALSRTMLAMLFTPGFAFAALVTNYLFERYAIYPTPDKETNVVVACTLGMILALLVLLIVIKASMILVDINSRTRAPSADRPRPQPAHRVRFSKPEV